jgi:hypothetical protein
MLDDVHLQALHQLTKIRLELAGVLCSIALLAKIQQQHLFIVSRPFLYESNVLGI